MDTSNRAGRRAAAKVAGVSGQVVEQLVVIDDADAPGANRAEAIAAAIVAALGSLIEQGGAPLERSVFTIGNDHPHHPGKLVVEAKTDRMAPRLLEKMGKPITLGELRANAHAERDPQAE